MVEAHQIKLVVPLCLVSGRHTEIKGLADGLEKCQKSLNDYLDSKRTTFPRFFFLSDDELLAILGNKHPSGIQEHIVKVNKTNAKTHFFDFSAFHRNR